MLISPAEPPAFKKLGTVSSQCERYGSDFLILSPVFGRVGVQRKEVKDLIASLADGRVEREIWQQKGLDQAIWLIEGRLEWTSDGQLLSGARSRYTKSQHLGVLLSLYSNGYWILNTSSVPDSIELLSALNQWLAKKKHTSLLRRPSQRTSYGTVGALKDQQIHVMQGFPGVGYDRAKTVVDHYGGLPFDLLVDLRDVAGLGDKTVSRIEGIVSRGA